MAKKQKSSHDRPPDWTRSNLPDATEQWADFALPPLKLQTPVVWAPRVSNWTQQAAHVRWESLTGTPLELNWMVMKSNGQETRPELDRRLELAWKREIKAAESQSKKSQIEISWKGEARSLDRYADLDLPGKAREYFWHGQLGCLAVFTLYANKQRLYVAASICPPAGHPQPVEAIRKILRSLEMFQQDEPLTVALGGLAITCPPTFTVESVRGQQGQLYVDLRDDTRRIGVARMAMAELHLSRTHQERLWTSMVKLLFDRGDVSDPINASLGKTASMFGPGIDHADPKRANLDPSEVHHHAAGLFHEKRRMHIRFGDAVLKKMGRKWSGGASALAWTCSDSHSIWALCVRSGDKDPEQEARSLLSNTQCHGRPEQIALNWGPYVWREANPPKTDTKKHAPHKDEKKKSKKDEPPERTPIEMRRLQLGFKVRPRKGVRLETYEADGTGALIYEVHARSGLVAKVLRGGRETKGFLKKLAMDPIGRRTWELLENGASIGEVLAQMCAEYAVHPVDLFHHLLAFMKLLGERNLVEALPDGSGETPGGTGLDTPADGDHEDKTAGEDDMASDTGSDEVATRDVAQA